MFVPWKRSAVFVAVALLEASCASPGGSGLVPGAEEQARQLTTQTIIGCRIVTPKKTIVLNPPPSESFPIPSSVNPSANVFYFEIGMGNWCYSLPAPLYATVPGQVNAAGTRVTFGAGHKRLVLKAGQSYVYAAYIVPATPARYLYVIDHTRSDVSVFLTGANGNVAPAYRINNVGGLYAAPQGIAEDAKGYIYVTTIAANGKTTSVLVYAPGAKGDAKPVRVITGPQTTLTNNSSDTGVGPDGSIYVNNGNGIAVFAPNADGDAKPVRLIKGLNGGGAAVSPSNVLYTTTQIGSNSAALYAFGPTANGHQPPIGIIQGARAGISTKLTGVDAQGNVYVCRDKAVTEFAQYQQGNVFPIRNIHGASLNFVGLQPIAVDGAGNVFVGDEDGGRLYRFAPYADGDVAPLATIAGSNTGIVNPAAIAVGR